MNELRDMFRRYKGQLSREEAALEDQSSPNVKDGPDLDPAGKGRGSKSGGKKKRLRDSEEMVSTSDPELEMRQAGIINGVMFDLGDGGEGHGEGHGETEALAFELSDGRATAVGKSDLHIWNCASRHVRVSAFCLHYHNDFVSLISIPVGNVSFGSSEANSRQAPDLRWACAAFQSQYKGSGLSIAELQQK